MRRFVTGGRGAMIGSGSGMLRIVTGPMRAMRQLICPVAFAGTERDEGSRC